MKTGTKKIVKIRKGARDIRNIFVGHNCIFGDKSLPAEYQEVEYLQSTGTQYIDTGYTLTSQKERIVCKAKLYPSYASVSLFGHNIPMGYSLLLWAPSATSLSVYVGLSNYSRLISHDRDTILKIELCADNGNLYSQINDDNFTNTYSGSLPTTGTIHLFSKQGGAETGHGCTIYYFAIYDNDKHVREFIPCYRKSDGEIGMYDCVNGVFYTNAGTGTFLKGGNIRA